MANRSERKAYDAMFVFLRNRYRLTKTDELGSLLGDLLIASEELQLGDPSAEPEHRTVDPATWVEWMEAVTEAEAGAPEDLYLRPGN